MLPLVMALTSMMLYCCLGVFATVSSIAVAVVTVVFKPGIVCCLIFPEN